MSGTVAESSWMNYALKLANDDGNLVMLVFPPLFAIVVVAIGCCLLALYRHGCICARMLVQTWENAEPTSAPCSCATQRTRHLVH